MRAFTSSHSAACPARLPGGISGSISLHLSSVLLVLIGDPCANPATALESRIIHMVQEHYGQTLRFDVNIIVYVRT
jgi:hypothetical protein